MKIVVIGVTGNIGKRIAKEALRRGHQVVGVVRDPAAHRPALRGRVLTSALG